MHNVYMRSGFHACAGVVQWCCAMVLCTGVVLVRTHGVPSSHFLMRVLVWLALTACARTCCVRDCSACALWALCPIASTGARARRVLLPVLVLCVHACRVPSAYLPHMYAVLVPNPKL